MRLRCYLYTVVDSVEQWFTGIHPVPRGYSAGFTGISFAKGGFTRAVSFVFEDTVRVKRTNRCDLFSGGLPQPRDLVLLT